MGKVCLKTSSFFLCLLLLFGCSAVSTSSTAPSMESSKPWSLPPGGTDEGTRTTENVEQIPQMAELHFAATLDTEVWTDFDIVNKVRQRGLRYPHEDDRLYARSYEYNSPPYNLYSYIWYLGILSGEISSDYYEEIPGRAIQKMAADALADPILVDAILNLLASWHYPRTDNYYGTSYYRGMGNHSDYTFSLYWHEDGNTRTVVLTDLVYYINPPSKDTYVFEYEKGEDGVWRLLGGQVIPPKETETAQAVENATLLENTPLTRQIIGSIGSVIISMDDWDHTLTLTALAADTFEQTAQTVVEGKLLDYRFRDAFLFLLFDDRVVLIDSSLNIAGEAALPKTLLDIINREPTYQAQTYGENDEYTEYSPDSAFGGYDVTADLKTFVYSIEDGTYLLDAATGSTTQIYKAERIDWPGYPNAIRTPYSPSFALGEQDIWGTLYQYEYSPEYFHYSLPNKRGEVLDHGDVLEYLHYSVGSLGNYFSSGGYGDSGSLYTGQNHYVANVLSYSSSTQTSSLLAGKLTDTVYPAKQLSYPIDYVGYILALLVDGRILFEYEGQYYCTQAY